MKYCVFYIRKVWIFKKQPTIKSFLGPFANFRKATLSFVISVRLFVRIEQLGYHWTYFHEILYLNIFRKYVEKIEVSLEVYKNNG
jgi:hypothetical protein